jgi:hypothetical protein
MGAWSDLNHEIPAMLESRATSLLDNIDRIIRYAERRVATEAPIIDLHFEVTDYSMTVNDRYVTRPTDILTVRYVDYQGASGRVQLKARPSDWLTTFWPDVAAVDPPKYYAMFDATRIAVAATPDDNYPVFFGVRKMPANLLSPNTEDNEITINCYNLLLDACLARGAIFLLDDRRNTMRETYEREYQRGLRTLQANEDGKVKDASHSPPPEGRP